MHVSYILGSTTNCLARVRLRWQVQFSSYVAHLLLVLVFSWTRCSCNINNALKMNAILRKPSKGNKPFYIGFNKSRTYIHTFKWIEVQAGKFHSLVDEFFPAFKLLQMLLPFPNVAVSSQKLTMRPVSLYAFIIQTCQLPIQNFYSSNGKMLLPFPNTNDMGGGNQTNSAFQP